MSKHPRALFHAAADASYATGKIIMLQRHAGQWSAYLSYWQEPRPGQSMATLLNAGQSILPNGTAGTARAVTDALQQIARDPRPLDRAIYWQSRHKQLASVSQWKAAGNPAGTLARFIEHNSPETY